MFMTQSLLSLASAKVSSATVSNKLSSEEFQQNIIEQLSAYQTSSTQNEIIKI